MDRASIAQAALELLDEVGLDGLTTRKLAAKLNVKSPALYWHFRNKQELVDEMARALQARQDRGPHGEGEPWRDWLARRARERRQVLLSRRDGARLVAGTSAGPELAIAFDRELEALTRQGFTPLAAMRAITTLGAFVTGFVLEEQVRGSRESQPRPPAEKAALTVEPSKAREAPPEVAELTPTLMAAIRSGGSPDNAAGFEEGLVLLLDGIEAGWSAAGGFRTP